MKRLIVIIALVCLFMKVNTSTYLNLSCFNESKAQVEKQNRDKIVLRLMATFSQLESGHNYEANGLSGEKGRYQYMLGTWKKLSMKYFGRVVPNTPEYQELLTYNVLYDYVFKGYRIDQISSIWNCGSPKYQGKIGVNRFGVSYNVPEYVNKFVNTYQKICIELSGTHHYESNRNLYLV